MEEIKKLISITSWFISLQVITLLAFLGGAAFIYADLHGLKQNIAATLAAGGGSSITTEIEGWSEYVREHNATSSTATAEIEIVEFTDFQCPYCKLFSESTRNQILSKYGGRVRFVFKHYPLVAIHPDAMQAAVAAQCALREGKFWEIKDIFFSDPSELSIDSLIIAGASLGLGDQYANCVVGQDTLVEVEQDIQDGLQLGVQGTPTFLINGKVAKGAISLVEFDAIVKQLN